VSKEKRLPEFEETSGRRAEEVETTERRKQPHTERQKTERCLRHTGQDAEEEWEPQNEGCEW